MHGEANSLEFGFHWLNESDVDAKCGEPNGLVALCPRRIAKGLAVTHCRYRSRERAESTEAKELVNSGWSGLAVGGQANVFLEFRHCIGSEATKNAINSIGIKSKGTKPLLEISNVITSKHWRHVLE
jgi:hypothetical protein